MHAICSRVAGNAVAGLALGLGPHKGRRSAAASARRRRMVRPRRALSSASCRRSSAAGSTSGAADNGASCGSAALRKDFTNHKRAFRISAAHLSHRQLPRVQRRRIHVRRGRQRRVARLCGNAEDVCCPSCLHSFSQSIVHTVAAAPGYSNAGSWPSAASSGAARGSPRSALGLISQDLGTS